jgi:hypothetical protein
MSKFKTYYLCLQQGGKGYVIVVSEQFVPNGVNHLPIKKNHWRAAVKHYAKYNLYDFFYKQTIQKASNETVDQDILDEGLGNIGDFLKKNKDRIKESAKLSMNFMMEKDDKGNFKVIRV